MISQPSPFRRAAHRLAIVLVSALGAGMAPGQQPGISSAPAPANERLVPGSYNQMKDAKGETWSFQNYGVLGRANSNSLINQVHQLTISGNNFYFNGQPMMTADGKEYVMQNQYPQQMMNLEVIRRVRLLEKEGVVRYIEVFHNPTSAPISTMVDLRTNFNGRFKDVVTDRGQANPTTLGKREQGVLVLPSNANQKALAYVVCSSRAGLKPAISTQNQYNMTFHYQISVPAGGTVCLLHLITAVDVPKKTDAKSLSKIFNPLSLHKFLRAVPREYRGYLENFSSGGEFGGVQLLSSMTIEGLGVERGAQDVLALGEATRLLGAASCASLKIATDYGEAEIPFEQVAALVGENRGRSNVSRVFLRDGQVFSGKAVAEGLRFVMPSGARLDLSMESLDRMVRKPAEEEGKWAEGTAALIETFHGDRIAVEGGDQALACVTPWGALNFAMDEVLWISPPDSDPVGHLIEFKDGSRLFAFMNGDPFALRSPLFGEHQIAPQQVRSIITAAALAKMREEESGDAAGGLTAPGAQDVQQPHLILAGGQRIVGRITAPYIHAVAHAEAIEVSPDTIRTLRTLRDEVELRPGEESAPFQIELWGGGNIQGHLRELTVPVNTRGQTWMIPVGDILEAHVPVPRISDETRQRIGELIRELGSEEWEVREGATEELTEYGFMAKGLLDEALQVNTDPEVRRRIEKILGSIQ